jgi:hypothetical protein
MATRGERLEEKERAQLRLGATHHGDAITWELLDAEPRGVELAPSAPPLPKNLTARAFTHDKGGALYFVAEEGKRAVATASAKGDITVVARTAFDVENIAIVEERFLVAGGCDGTHVFDLQALDRGAIGKLPGLGTRPSPEPALGAILEGRVLWHRPKAHTSTSFYRVEKSALKRVETIDVPLTIVETKHALYGRANFSWIELNGVDSVIAAASVPVGAPPRHADSRARPLRPRDARTPTASARLSLVPIRGAAPPSPPLPASFTKVTKRASTWHRINDAGRAISFDGKKSGDVSWIDRAGKARTFNAPTLPRTLDLADDGTVLIALYDRLLFFDDAASKAPVEKKVPAKIGSVLGAYFCADGLVAVLGPKGLHLVTRAGALKASAPITQPWYMVPFRGGSLLVVTAHGKNGVLVYEAKKGKLAAKLKATESAAMAYAAGDRFVVQTHAGGFFELV